MSSYAERKYTIENILNALKPFKTKNPPAENSLPSIFKNICHHTTTKSLQKKNEKTINLLTSNDHQEIEENDNKTHLIKICYRNARMHCSLKHWYIEIDNKYRWHPGEKGIDEYTKNPTIFTPLNMDCEDMLQPNIASIYEMCSHCTYWFMLDKIHNDIQFNVIVNNCELIVGYGNETILIWMTVLFTLATVMTQNLFFIILTIVFFVITVFAFTNSHPITLKRCIHIRSFVENQTVIKVNYNKSTISKNN